MSYHNYKGDPKILERNLHQAWMRDVRGYTQSELRKKYNAFLEAGLVDLHEDEKPRVIADTVLVYSASFMYTPPSPVRFILVDFAIDNFTARSK